jgi:hypothetical protein
MKAHGNGFKSPSEPLAIAAWQSRRGDRNMRLAASVPNAGHTYSRIIVDALIVVLYCSYKYFVLVQVASIRSVENGLVFALVSRTATITSYRTVQVLVQYSFRGRLTGRKAK